MSDLRHALRQLARQPGFTLVVIVTLALAIGATSAIFSLADAYLLRPLPFPGAERLVGVADVQPGWGEAPLSFEEWRDLEEHGRMFEALAAQFPVNVSFAEGELPERIRMLLVNREHFEMFGLTPVAGRLFVPEEEIEGGPAAVIVSESFWRSRLGASEAAVGEVIRLSDRAYTLVGVVRDPDRTFGPAVAAYAPLEVHAPWRTRGSHYLRVTGRLRPGVSLAAARAELGEVAARLQEDRGTTHGFAVSPLREELAGDVRPLLLALLGAVSLVLAIATANVANLSLVRAARRREELAVRSALGASRLRLARQSLVESLVLGGVGAAAGALVAWWGGRLLVAALPASLPHPGNVGLDHRMFLFIVAVAVASATLFGLAPAWLETRPATGGTGGARLAGGSPGPRRLRRGLVVAEVALAAVLLSGAALMIQSLDRLLKVDPGFDAEGLLTFSTSLPAARYSEPAQRLAFVDEMIARIAGLPGVAGVGVANNLPLGGTSMSGDVRVEGRTEEEADLPFAEKRVVGDGYFESLGIPLRRGRLFTPADRDGSPPVVVVNETLAHRLWPGEEALGQRIRSLTCGDCWEEIVGVVADVREYALHQEPPLQVYYPLRQIPQPALGVVVRTVGDPETLVLPVRRAVAEVDPQQPIFAVRTMREAIAGTVADRRLAAVLLTAFAALAVVLAAVGVGGVLSYSAARRTREIGLRMALGATRPEVVRMVVGEGMRYAALGLGLGLPLAFALANLLRSQLYEVAPGQSLAYAGSAVVLGLVALAACYWPARRAARTDPMVALNEPTAR